jgi:riboflavin kinase/FMN adenylyltransferase
VAVGVFDGLHLGHRSIIKKTVAVARKNKALGVVFTFFPHPDSVIHSEKKSPLLISLKHRLSLISDLGVDICVVVKFSSYFMNMEPSNFIKNILIKKCRMKYLVLNKNFTFGKNRVGDEELIKKLSRQLYFKAYFQKDIKSCGHIISSTLIRSLIKGGNLKMASKLLGRNVEVIGTVTGGDRRGRKIGFPTANIDPHHEVIPAKGVYLIEVYLAWRKLLGLANIGLRPTFKKEEKETIEIHLLNFKRNIYKKELRIVFLKKLRNERKFSNKTQLVNQIKRDLKQARRFFSI